MLEINDIKVGDLIIIYDLTKDKNVKESFYIFEICKDPGTEIKSGIVRILMINGSIQYRWLTYCMYRGIK